MFWLLGVLLVMHRTQNSPHFPKATWLVFLMGTNFFPSGSSFRRLGPPRATRVYSASCSRRPFLAPASLTSNLTVISPPRVSLSSPPLLFLSSPSLDPFLSPCSCPHFYLFLFSHPIPTSFFSSPSPLLYVLSFVVHLPSPAVTHLCSRVKVTLPSLKLRKVM